MTVYIGVCIFLTLAWYIDYTDDERLKLANKSRTVDCDTCGSILNLLLDDSAEDNDKAEIKKYAAQLEMTKPKEDGQGDSATTATGKLTIFISLR